MTRNNAKAKKNKQETESVETEKEVLSDQNTAIGITDAIPRKRGKTGKNLETITDGENGTENETQSTELKTEETCSKEENGSNEDTEESKEKEKEAVNKVKPGSKRGGKQAAANKKKTKVADEQVEKPVEDEEKPLEDKPEEKEIPVEEEEPEPISKRGATKRTKQANTNAKKKAKSEDESKKEVDYEVEKVIDVRKKRDGKQEFLIRWRGYAAKDDTWEPEDNLECENLITEFFNSKEEVANGNAKVNKRGGKKKEEKAETKNYEVEKVVDSKEKKDGKREFKIRWKGYAAKDDTWEPEDNLDCADLIKDFLDKQQTQDNDAEKPTKKGVAKKKEETSEAQENVTEKPTKKGGAKKKEESSEEPTKTSTRRAVRAKK